MEEWDESYFFYHYQRPEPAGRGGGGGWITGGPLVDFLITCAFLFVLTYFVANYVVDNFQRYREFQQQQQQHARPAVPPPLGPSRRSGALGAAIGSTTSGGAVDDIEVQRLRRELQERDALLADMRRVTQQQQQLQLQLHQPQPFPQQQLLQQQQLQQQQGQFFQGNAFFGLGNGSPPRSAAARALFSSAFPSDFGGPLAGVTADPRPTANPFAQPSAAPLFPSAAPTNVAPIFSSAANPFPLAPAPQQNNIFAQPPANVFPPPSGAPNPFAAPPAAEVNPFRPSEQPGFFQPTAMGTGFAQAAPNNVFAQPAAFGTPQPAVGTGFGMPMGSQMAFGSQQDLNQQFFDHPDPQMRATELAGTDANGAEPGPRTHFSPMGGVPAFGGGGATRRSGAAGRPDSVPQADFERPAVRTAKGGVALVFGVEPAKVATRPPLASRRLGGTARVSDVERLTTMNHRTPVGRTIAFGEQSHY